MRVVGKRWLLAAAVVVAGKMSRADQPPKVLRAAALYQETPRGGLSCAGCTFFRRPRSCEVVAGDISQTGWCRLFDLPD